MQKAYPRGFELPNGAFLARLMLVSVRQAAIKQFYARVRYEHPVLIEESSMVEFDVRNVAFDLVLKTLVIN